MLSETEFVSLVERLKSLGRLSTLDEAATRQGLVLPILQGLGWDVFNVDEVTPEYSVGNGRVDYALRLGAVNKVFLEVKKPSEDLEKHQDQLLDYSFRHGVKLAALTNGTSWWFYLPLNEGSWEQRKFYVVDLAEQASTEVASRFKSYLARIAVESGKAVDAATSVYHDRQKARTVEQALPLAWNKLVTEGDESLTETIADLAEKLCGHKPDSSAVDEFLAKNREKLTFEQPKIGRVPKQQTDASERAGLLMNVHPINKRDFTGTSLRLFVFD